MTEADRLNLLDGRHFGATDVMRAARITSFTLGNYLSKSPLQLCSPATGQGRARRYCLIDVYQIVLLDILGTITGRVAFSAEALNYNLFVDEEMRDLTKNYRAGKSAVADADYQAQLDKVKDKFCDSIRATPECYYHRDLQDCVFLVMPRANIVLQNHTLDFGRRDSLTMTLSRHFEGGVIWNVTAHLSAVDEVLLAAVKDRRPHA